MRHLVISSEALDNLAAIEAFIADRADPDIAKALVEQMTARCERLAALPGLLGTARPDLAPDLRSTPHNGYVIYFRYEPDVLAVVTVLDARRDALAHFGPDDAD